MSDAERFERIYRSTYAALTAYARRRLPAREIDDVVANVYLAMWRKLDSVPSDPLPWLYRAAWLEIASAHRTASRQPIPPADPDRDVGAALPDHSDETADRVSVAAALERLPARDAEILRLRYWEDLDGPELATASGCSPVAARVRLHRARVRLAALLEPAADQTRQDVTNDGSIRIRPRDHDWSRR